MAEWKHHIPVEQYWRDLDDLAMPEVLVHRAQQVSKTLIEHRVFLRYIELDEEEIDDFSDIADDFYPTAPEGTRLPARSPTATEFDEALERLYDWADKNRIAIV